MTTDDDMVRAGRYELEIHRAALDRTPGDGLGRDEEVERQPDGQRHVGEILLGYRTRVFRHCVSEGPRLLPPQTPLTSVVIASRV